MCKKLIYLISVLVLALCLIPSAKAANITLVTENHDEDADGIPDDQQLVDWLVAEGHVVDVQRDYWTAFGRTTSAELNSADLIIVSRTTSSGNYIDEDEPTKWNSLTVPLILMSAYPVRSSHWKWVDSTSVLGEGGAPMLEAVDPGHPIFTNVPLDASNQVQIVDGAVGSGHTSFIDVADVGNGTLIATAEPNDLPWIVEWDAGVEFYAGAGEVPAGKRLMFLAGTQEPPTWGQWNLTAEGEILFRNAISYMLGEPIVPILPPPPALVGHWKFDDGEGAVAVDSSGNGNDGIINGDPLWVEGMLDGALEFDGDGDWIDCGTDPSLNINIANAVTVTAWIKVAVQGLDHKVGGNQDNASGGYKMSVYSDKIEFEIRTSGNSAVLNRSVEGGTILEADVWYHVAGVYSLSDGYIRTYVNGVLDRELLTTEALGASPGSFKIGCEPFTTGSYNFNGVMDDIRVYDGALTEEEVQAVMMPIPEPVDPGTEGLVAHYAFENNADDSSGNELHGTLVGDPTFAEGPAGYGMALDLDGDGDYVDCGAPPQFDITEQIAITYWIKVVAFDKGWNTVLSRGDDSWRSSRAGENNFMEAAVSGTTGDWTYGVTPVDDEKWHHIAWIYDGTMNYMYLDGKLDASEESTGLITVSTYPLFIGNNSQNTDREWTGLIDEVMIYNRALSEAEVMYLAGKRATPADPGSDGLVAYYALENNTDDSSGNELHGTIFGEPAYVEGPAGYGTAMSFDGVDDYVDFGNDPLFDITGEVTLALWVNTQDIGTGQDNPWLGKGDTTYMIKGYREGNQIEFFIYDGGWQSSFADVGDSFNGAWHHAAGTFDAEQFLIYVDGELETTLGYEGVGIVPNTYNVAMGTNTQASGRFSESIMDEAVIYNRALSAGEIRYLAGFRPMVDPGTDGLAAAYYFETDATDSSGNGNDGTLLGDAHVADGLLVLDGDDDAVAIPGIGDGLTEFTFSMMVYPTVDVVPLQFSGGINTDSWGGGVHLKLNYGTVNVGVEPFAGGDVVGTSIAQPNTWTHLALTVSPEEVAVYFNGVKEGSRIVETGLSVNVGAATIGAWNNGGTDVQREMTGQMDDVLIYDRALSEAEILYLANN